MSPQSFFKRHILTGIGILSFFLLFLILKVSAITNPYSPGETLNPDCAPGDDNCTVSVGTDLTFNSPLSNTDGDVSIDLSDLVNINDDQTIEGTKTFSLSPVVPEPENGNEAASKDYVDNVAVGLVWKDPVATYTDIATTYPAPEEHWAVMVEDEGRSYVYNGSSWVHFGSSGTYLASADGGLELVNSNEFQIKSSGVTDDMILGPVSVSKGGTGLSAFGTAGQVMKVNETEDGLEWGDMAGNSNDWATLTNFPSACGDGDFVTAIGATLTCATPPGGTNSLIFSDSLTNTDGTVTLVNDSAAPGNSKYYGTNGSGTLGYFDLPEGGTGSGWSLTGNAGTTDGVNFMGTTDDVPLTLKVNNNMAGRIDNTLSNAFWGYRAGKSNTTGNWNIAIGSSALLNNTNGSNNVAIGTQSLMLMSDQLGFNNTAVGTTTLRDNIGGSYNTAIGDTSLVSNTTGNSNTGIGRMTLYSNTTGNGNVALGYQAGYYETGSNNLFIDNQKRTNESDGRIKSLIYGNFDADPANQFIRINGALQILEGGTSPQYHTIFQGGDQSGNITYTLPINDGDSGQALTTDGSGVLSWATVGGGSGWGLIGNAGTTDGVNFIGTTDNIPLTFKVNNEKAGRIDPTLNNTFFGYQAGNAITTGYKNVALGDNALKVNTEGYENIAIGYQALDANISGYGNVAIGKGALTTSSTAIFNTATGFGALGNATNGSNNTAFGKGALAGVQTGSGNVALGFNAGYLETGSNALYIDNDARTSLSNAKIKSLIYGNFDADPANQFVRINGALQILEGGTSPQYHTIFQGGDQSGNITYTLPTADGTSGQFLSTNGSGVLSWASETLTINPQTDDYVLVIGDAGKLIEMNKGTAVDLTVPQNSSVPFPVGTTITVIQKGAGQVTIVEDTNVTINSKNGLKLTGQYAGATLIKSDTNTWYLNGDTEI